MSDAPDDHRLPRSVVPSRYDVRLVPDLDDAAFSGTVTIAIDVVEPVDEVVLNALDLTVHRCELDGREVGATLDTDAQRLHVASGDLAVGPHSLRIDFDGVLNDKLCGFYRSTFTDDAGVERVIATTQMEATDCRRAFPCWDEPDFKAVFAITLDVAEGLVAVSNSPEVSRRAHDGRVEITFGDTMVMSSYLVAMVVGPLEVTDVVDADGVPLRVVHPPGKKHLTGFALDVGAFCLEWFQRYYGIPYPGDKVDLVAIPDFAAGAMENLGCITFRESLLLVDPARATQTEQQLVVDVVAHELAHMWFGDLVTMSWWNGLWLNEAFATFMELAACDAYRPDWARWTSFGTERSAAFEVDSLRSTRAIEFPVRSPEDAEAMFDVLTYQKGGALLRMLEQYLGEERFRAGVSHYLRTHSYANTETGDLWDAIEHTSGEPVRRIMDSWIWQPGFPLVSADLDGAELVLRQRRFAFGDERDEVERDDVTWVVPLLVRNGGRTDSVLLDGPELRVPLHDPSGHVVVNAGGHGFLRVAYDDELRARLTGEALAGLDTLERYTLVDDAWNAVVAGELSASAFLDLADGFADERDLAVWQAIVGGLRGVARLVDGEVLTAVRARVRRLVTPTVEALGEPREGDDDLTNKLRGLLIGTLAVLGDDEPTQQRARAWFDAASDDASSVHPELASVATSIVAATGDRGDYERVLAGFRSAATPQDELRHLYALAETADEQLLVRTCELAFGGDVKTQNAPFLLARCIANRDHGAAAWTVVRSRWDEAVERFPSNTIVRMVGPVQLLNRPEQVADVAAFFAEHPIPQAAKTLEQTLERQRVNAAARTREAAGLREALVGG